MLEHDEGELEWRLERDFHREPSLGSRRKPALNERGAVRTFIEATLVAAEKPWRPSDENGGR
jgi:hypothetical protein